MASSWQLERDVLRHLEQAAAPLGDAEKVIPVLKAIREKVNARQMQATLNTALGAGSFLALAALGGYGVPTLMAKAQKRRGVR